MLSKFIDSIESGNTIRQAILEVSNLSERYSSPEDYYDSLEYRISECEKDVQEYESWVDAVRKSARDLNAFDDYREAFSVKEPDIKEENYIYVVVLHDESLDNFYEELNDDIQSLDHNVSATIAPIELSILVYPKSPTASMDGVKDLVKKYYDSGKDARGLVDSILEDPSVDAVSFDWQYV